MILYRIIFFSLLCTSTRFGFVILETFALKFAQKPKTACENFEIPRTLADKNLCECFFQKLYSQNLSLFLLLLNQRKKKNLLAEKPEFKPIFFLHSREICTRNWRKINHVRVLFGVNLIRLTSYLAEVEYTLQWRLLGDGDSCCFKKTK